MSIIRRNISGDIDGFLALFIDNLVQVLVISHLCTVLLGFPLELIYGRIFPGIAVSLAVGNFFYAYQAYKLSKKEGRSDVCALPYGINTLTVFVFIFLVLVPAKVYFEKLGEAQPYLRAWQVGLAACFFSGLIEFLGSISARYIKKWIPRTAMLSTLSGIAISFISFPFLLQSFDRPIVGLTTIFVLLCLFIHKYRVFRLSGGIIILVIGIVLSYATGSSMGKIEGGLDLYFPIPVFSDLMEGIAILDIQTCIRFVLPMGIFTLVGSIQNIESAESAGDSYDPRPSLAVNGLGSMLAGAFGSCFPTTIYIGHPAFKAMGSRWLYSSLNATVFLVLICSGAFFFVASFLPMESIIAIMLWIGIMISVDTFQVVEKKYYIAAIMGLFPSIASWGVHLAKVGYRSAGALFTDTNMYTTFLDNGVDIRGGLHLEQGFMFTSIIFSAMTVYIIDKKFLKVAAWALIGALLSLIGLTNSYTLIEHDSVLNFPYPDMSFVYAYSTIFVVFICIFFLDKKKFFTQL